MCSGGHDSTEGTINITPGPVICSMRRNVSESAVRAIGHERRTVYCPKVRPGYAAWVTGFEYGDGSIGLSFTETIAEPNPDYVVPALELAEAICMPVSYGSVFCGDRDHRSYRVYLRSTDDASTFHETGRCSLEQGTFSNVGFPDGRIVGYDVPVHHPDGSSGGDYIAVRESLDGGSTWTEVAALLRGTAPYMWRARRLRSGRVIICASLYGTPWGPGAERRTRNTMLPYETYIGKIQPMFLSSEDGVTFDGPHYILAGTGAHEFDFVETADDELLFIVGDVQATPVARQIVRRVDGRYLIGAVLPIHQGRPPDPGDPQGGFVPESVVRSSDGLIVGSRRRKQYSGSRDGGLNWTPIENLPKSLYQPFALTLSDGRIANFGQYGGDVAFGEVDMYIGVDVFGVEDNLPGEGHLTLERMMSEDRSEYINGFEAAFTNSGQPVPDVDLTFRFTLAWNEDGTASQTSQDDAPLMLRARTDAQGRATIRVPQFDASGDIHFFYRVDVVYEVQSGGPAFGCQGPMMDIPALSARRGDPYPHDAYFSLGVLFLSPKLLGDHPDAISRLQPYVDAESAAIVRGTIPDDLLTRLQSAGVVVAGQDGLEFRKSVHPRQGKSVAEVREMSAADWYV